MPTTEFYDRYYAAAENSLAHALFCTRVYGRDLCQHGMADMVQIDMLIEMLSPKLSDRLLDLGCGNGRITEYIQSVTGAIVTGIDLSPVAIQRATQHTAGSSGRLNFRLGDMGNLRCPPDSFEAIVLIDSHYFVEDLEGLLKGLMAMLSPGGRIGLFSDEGSGVSGRDDSELDARESRIGQFLKREGVRFGAVNLTKQNRDHWRLKREALLELKDEFAREGNTFLYENRMKECTCTDRDLDCRFLFLIHKAG
jgi:SAM-dependent methyltransferase